MVFQHTDRKVTDPVGRKVGREAGREREMLKISGSKWQWACLGPRVPLMTRHVL